MRSSVLALAVVAVIAAAFAFSFGIDPSTLPPTVRGAAAFGGRALLSVWWGKLMFAISLAGLGVLLVGAFARLTRRGSNSSFESRRSSSAAQLRR